MNFIQVDAKKFVDIAEALPSVASFPMVIVVTIILLFIYFEIGFLSGLATIIIFVGLNFIFAKITTRYQALTMKKLDIRMNIMSECFDNIFSL